MTHVDTERCLPPIGGDVPEPGTQTLRKQPRPKIQPCGSGAPPPKWIVDSATMPADYPTLLADRYALQQRLQSGGMATVFRARDLLTDDLVAVKYFDRDRNLPDIEREAFRREVEALRNLKHPNILSLHNAGEDPSGRFYIVLDLMKHDLLEERALGGQAFEGWDDFADIILLPLIDALSAAHQAGIAHRDVKPANILIADDGTVRLADFSISKLKRTLHPRTTLNAFMSPPFAPPEPDCGSYSYARDVYAIAAIAVWAMSHTDILDHAGLITTLPSAEFAVFPSVVEVITRCLSLDPSARFQNAPMLAAELGRIQAARRQRWQATERPACLISLKPKALESLQSELAVDSISDLHDFVSNDINLDSSIARFIEHYGKPEQRVRPGHYSIYGGLLRYHIAADDRKRDAFVVLNVTREDPDRLQRRRDESMACPLRFSLGACAGSIGPQAAHDHLLESLESHETARSHAREEQERSSLFDLWIRVLQARLQFAKDAAFPVRFHKSDANGSFVTVYTESDVSHVHVGDAWVVDSDGSKGLRGEVWEVSSDRIVLNCTAGKPPAPPRPGVLRPDLYALKVALDRQRESIDQIRSGACVRSSLSDVLRCPDNLPEPMVDAVLCDEVRGMLDDSKRHAVGVCLASNDLVLVEGPPGTGKTQFIVGLILETIARDPAARILIASQTHIALDNAIERLSRIWDQKGLIRIARDNATSVAETSRPFLLAAQMQAWRAKAIGRATEGLAGWASDHGIEFSVLRLASVLTQLSASTARINALRETIGAEEQRQSSMFFATDSVPPGDQKLELDRILSVLDDLRDQLETEKSVRARLQDELKTLREDYEVFLQKTPEDQLATAEELIGQTAGGAHAQDVSALQAEWFDRFSSKKGLIAPLIERSAVLASTCVGLASLDEASRAEFDLCIIDEASKATAMEACVPMSRAKKWVLVGDSKQLPPFQEEALESASLREHFNIEGREADESMFERMRRLAPSACRVMLTTQYRMVEPIGRLVSECFYDGQLTSVRSDVDPHLCRAPWRAVNWFSTRELTNRREERVGTSFVNAEEASRICNLLWDIDVGLEDSPPREPRKVLILSGYGAQVQHLSRRVNAIRSELRHLDVECCTIDRVQGREADIVMFSVTRSNADERFGFLGALERINVALSRALDLLVIVGDDEFVQSARGLGALQSVLSYIRGRPEDCFMAVFGPETSAERR